MDENSILKPKAPYNKENEVIADLFEKKCKQFYTKRQIIDYLLTEYGYTPDTAQKYHEKLWQFITENISVDYEQDLAQTIEYMQQQIQNETNSFTRLQWVKELNKIKGLHINKYQVESTIKNISVIELNYNTPATPITTDNTIALNDGNEVIDLNKIEPQKIMKREKEQE